MLNIKNQRGSVALFALVSCVFFVASVACVNLYMQSKQTAVDREYKQIKSNYEITISKLKEQGKILEENTTLLDDEGVVITIPAGFKVNQDSPTVAKEGIIIEDEKGNQFVWIPVYEDLTVAGTNKKMAQESTENEYKGKDSYGRTNYEGVLYNFTGEGEEATSTEMLEYGQGTANYREPDIIGLDEEDKNLKIIRDILTDEAERYSNKTTFKETMQEDYNEMVESVTKYGGFYVGRYEMGQDGNNPLSKYGEATSASEEEANTWYGLYALGKNYSNDYNSVKSSMIWGSQYQAALNYALNGDEKAKVVDAHTENHKKSKAKTGENQEDKILNIYDLEGNLWDMGLTATSDPQDYSRAVFGGYYENDYTAKEINWCEINETNNYCTSRLSLYITDKGTSELERLKESGILNKNLTVQDSEGNKITIPAGFKVNEDSPTAAKEGIIIEDENKNQFVWIPVEKDLTVVGTNKKMAKKPTAEGIAEEDDNGRTNYEGVLYDFEDTSSNVMSEGITYKEPETCKLYDENPENLEKLVETLRGEEEAAKYASKDAFKNTMQEDYNEMIESVKTYGGFFVGRYEMGLEDGKATSKEGTATDASQYDTTCSWYGLYAYGKEYANTDNSVKSSMIWGSQYDAILNYALTVESEKEKITVTGNADHTLNAPIETGATSEDKILNIFDLEGNHLEWTLENNELNRTCRGGGCGQDSSNPPSYRLDNTPDNESNGIGSRITLYIKDYKMKTISDVKEYGILNKTVTVTDGETEGKKITIPAGFTVAKNSPDKINEGIVIKDKKGNEFVWIPCTEEEYNQERDPSWLRRSYDGGTWGDSQPHKIGIPSIRKYGGFYVGRYEAGIPEDAPFYADEEGDTYYDGSIDASGTTKNTNEYIPVSKKGVQAWNCINYENAKEVSENMVKTKDVKSYLIDSHAWDTICRVIDKYDTGKDIINSSNIGNYIDNISTNYESIDTLYAIHNPKTWEKPETYKKGLVEGAPKGDGENRLELSTGASEDFKTFNIYDFGGNMFEMTTERGNIGSEATTTIQENDIENPTRHVVRGGGFNDRTNSGSLTVTLADDLELHVTKGFRVVLYIQ